MFIRTEDKPNGWRAVAIFEDGTEALIVVGRTSNQVRCDYGPAIATLFSVDELKSIRSISLQSWFGSPDAGKWVDRAKLDAPPLSAQSS